MNPTPCDAPPPPAGPPRAPAGPVGLYAITPDWSDTGRLAEAVAAVLAGGAAALQYRNKLADAPLRASQADRLRALCAAAGVPFLVNDDLALALAVDADGLHAGRDDGDPRGLRERLGDRRWLGVSCYAEPERAVAADGIADHVAFGAVFASGTKPAAARAPLALLGESRRAGRHVVAIGGITPANAADVFSAGAHAIAVIGALFDAPDPEAAARAFVACVPAAAPR